MQDKPVQDQVGDFKGHGPWVAAVVIAVGCLLLLGLGVWSRGGSGEPEAHAQDSAVGSHAQDSAIELIDADIVLYLDPEFVAASGGSEEQGELKDLLTSVQGMVGVEDAIFSPAPAIRGIVPDAPAITDGEPAIVVSLADSASTETRDALAADFEKLEGVVRTGLN